MNICSNFIEATQQLKRWKNGNSSEVIESIIGDDNQCELQSLEIHFVETVWSLVGLRPKIQTGIL